jgi:hypothetical protein
VSWNRPVLKAGQEFFHPRPPGAFNQQHIAWSAEFFNDLGAGSMGRYGMNASRRHTRGHSPRLNRVFKFSAHNQQINIKSSCQGPEILMSLDRGAPQLQHISQGRQGSSLVLQIRQSLQSHGHGTGISVVTIIQDNQAGLVALQLRAFIETLKFA